MQNKKCVTRRALVAGTSACILSTVGAARAKADVVAASLSSSEGVEFTYIESSAVFSGNEQIVAIVLKSGTNADDARLTLQNTESSDSFETSASVAQGSSVLFTFSAPAAGTWRISSVTCAGGAQIIDFSDCASEAASFCVMEVPDAKTNMVTNSAEFDSEGSLIDSTALTEDELLDSDESLQTRSSWSGGLTVALNPGHGGYDPGAESNGDAEAEITWKITQYCRAALELYNGVRVFVTRTKNECPSLQERVNRAAGAGCDIYVSLHINAGGGRGAEVWIPYNSSYRNSAHVAGERLGDDILAELSKLGINNRGTKTRIIDDEVSSRYGYDSNGDGVNDVYADYYGDIRYARLAGMPGIIVEHAFIDSSDYWNYLNADYKLRALGEADARGIAATYGLTKDADDPNRIKMYRLYNPYTGEHFYTADKTERADLITCGWNPEGIGWYAPPKSNAPVYRLNNPFVYGGDHHYTMSAEERDECIEAGWVSEGIGWYSDDAHGTRLLREYNPNAATGSHNYTTSEKEHSDLIGVGWRDEGVAWFGLS